MNLSRQIALSVALSLLLPGLALAAGGSGYQLDPSSPPVMVSQNLPPVQGPGYSTPTNNNSSYSNYGGSSSYNSQPYTPPQQYSQQQQYAPQPSYQPQSNYQPQSSYQQQSSYQPQAPLQGYVVTAPAGTVVSGTLGSPISSEFARVGDHFTATLGSPITSGSSIILPAGSQMDGQVMMVKPSGHTGRNGELDIRFTSATLPNGQRVPLSARIQTEDGTGIIKGGTTATRAGRAAVNTGVGAGLGAALGTAMGPLSGGGVGRGAIYGTVLGAGMGALGSAWQKGKPATVQSGQPVNIVLDQPLTATPSSPADNYSQQQSPSSYYQPSGGQPAPQPNNFYGGQ